MNVWRLGGRPCLLLATLGCGFSLLLAPRPSRAELFELGLGATFFGGYARLPAPVPDSLRLPRSQRTAVVPSFEGSVYGAGVTLEPRLLGSLGIELNAWLARDFLTGTVGLGADEAQLRIGQVAVHLPVLAKARVGLGPVGLTAALGPEWVIPTLPEAEVSSGPLVAIASADPSIGATLALGGEVDVFMPGWDIRWPFQLRLTLIPTVKSELSSRVTALPSDAVIFESIPQYQVSFVTGLVNFW